MSESATLGSLFLSGLISATLLPGGSEALFAWLLQQAAHAPLQLWLTVSAGNALGGGITLLMGGWLARRCPLRVPDKPLQQHAYRWLQRFGPWTLLFAWLPLLGDPLCFVAGWLRLNFLFCLFMLTLGKALRYGALLILIV